MEPDHVYAIKNQGNALQGLAGIQAKLSETDAARESYTAAIAAYEQALALAPDHKMISDNLAIALSEREDLIGDNNGERDRSP